MSLTLILNAPAGFIHKSLIGLFNQPPRPTQPQRWEEQSYLESGRKGLDVWCQRCPPLECPASPLTWSLTKCHPLQEAFSDHLGPECRETGEAEAQVSSCFHLGWEWTLLRLRGTGLGRRLHFRHAEVEVPWGHLDLG